MNFTVALNKLSDQKIVGSEEVILRPESLSRMACLKDSECFDHVGIYEWDLILDDSQFARSVSFLEKINRPENILRVQDMGAFEWAINNWEGPVDFIAEAGFNNTAALLQLEREARGLAQY